MFKIITMVSIIFLSACSPVVQSSIVEKNNTNFEQLKKTNFFYYYVNPTNQSQAMGIVSGIFLWKDECLYLIDPNGTYSTAMFPQYPKDIVKWDEANKILTLDGKVFKMGDYISTNGMYITYDPDNINHKIYGTQGNKRCLSSRLAYIGTISLSKN